VYVYTWGKRRRKNMYRRIDDFIAEWRQESAGTVKILRALTDESLTRKVDPEGRTLGFIAWHLVLTLGEMGNRAGLAVEAPPENVPEPQHAAEILEAYRAAAASLGEMVGKTWDDGALEEEMDMYGQPWKKGFILNTVILHEVHHRGQMTVLMRQAGLPVPGVCGPSREEWCAYGMEPQK
jgi:uncharacterized damage-inducible protein DinB